MSAEEVAVHQAIVRLSPWLQHARTCARITAAAPCTCGLQAALLRQRSPTTPDPRPWQLTTRPALRLWDRLRLLVGVPLFVRFTSPDGACHAACALSLAVQREWPAEADVLDELPAGWPPLVRPLPPPPPPPDSDPGRRLRT